MIEIIEKYFPNLTEEQKKQFEALDALYRDWNSKINVISAYNDPCELTMDELKALNPDFQSKYTEYGDAAIVVVSRVGGEGGAYYPGEEGLADGVHTVNGNILSLSDEEMAMIEEAKANFDKVIVLVNAANPMEIANLQDDPDIDAILWVGYPGAYGFYAVADVLNGTVAPSAHLGENFLSRTAPWLLPCRTLATSPGQTLRTLLRAPASTPT